MISQKINNDFKNFNLRSQISLETLNSKFILNTMRTCLECFIR